MPDLKNLIPSVTTEEKDVSGWDDLRDSRAKYAPILGKDSWVTVLKYNFAQLFFCELLSKAGAWAVGATTIALTITYFEANNTKSWVMSSLQTWFVWGLVMLSSLHWAAKDQFRQLMSAISSKVSGTPITRVTTDVTATPEKTMLKKTEETNA